MKNIQNGSDSFGIGGSPMCSDPLTWIENSNTSSMLSVMWATCVTFLLLSSISVLLAVLWYQLCFPGVPNNSIS